MEQTSKPSSPGWGTNTKLVVALTIVVVVGALLVKFQFIITPLAMAFLLSYLFHPVADFLQRKLRFSWNAAVGSIFLLIVLLLLSLLTLGGVGLVQQVQSLVIIVQDALRTLPQLIQDISGRVFQIGPFKVDFSHLDLNDLSQQALDMIQPLLSRTGSLLRTVAGGAANFFGWTLFVLLVAYFTLIESKGIRDEIITVNIPGYNQDFGRLSRELGRIWNAFLRGQIIIFFLAVIVYFIVLSLLGVSYAIGLAFLAGLARFVPYVGPAVNWTLLVIVAYFQQYTIFHLPDLTYTVIVLVIALIIDQIFDNIINPRILSSALKVHPAAVLVAAIIAANLFGILGVVVAAPILATVMLFWNYVMRKMFDLDPFPEKEIVQPPPPPGSRVMVALRRFIRDRKPGAKK
ncbi:MAG: AI-2E family transporter [Chloroflexota bacterium]|nr:AI-2E family transporter [Anaerolineales bacterium]NUQ59072.1 AI-2E family transporter [Anaerolineales bacterium]